MNRHYGGGNSRICNKAYVDCARLTGRKGSHIMELIITSLIAATALLIAHLGVLVRARLLALRAQRATRR